MGTPSRHGARLTSVLQSTEPPPSFREALIAKTELAHRVRASCEIFWGLVSKESRDLNGDLIDRARHFFGYTAEAHLAYVVVGLSRFFDTDKRSLSLPNLRAWAVREGFRKDAVRRSKEKLRPVSDRVKRLVDLRNAVYAHRSIDISYREAFLAANLKYKDLFTISDAILGSLNELRLSIGLGESEYSTVARDDTRFVLEWLAHGETEASLAEPARKPPAAWRSSSPPDLER